MAGSVRKTQRIRVRGAASRRAGTRSPETASRCGNRGPRPGTWEALPFEPGRGDDHPVGTRADSRSRMGGEPARSLPKPAFREPFEETHMTRMELQGARIGGEE